MASGYEVVDEVRLGDQEASQEGVASEWKTIRAVFPNFAELPSERGDETHSPVLKCHGFKWTINIFPGGDRKSSKRDDFVSVYLSCKSCSNTNKIRAKHRKRVPSAGKVVMWNQFKIFSTSDVATEAEDWGGDFAKRKDILDTSKNFLVDGNLTVEVDIQVMLDEPTTWIPTNTICSDMIAFLDAANVENTDVSFEVHSEDGGKELLYAHATILAARCPTLASLAESCDDRYNTSYSDSRYNNPAFAAANGSWDPYFGYSNFGRYGYNIPYNGGGGGYGGVRGGDWFSEQIRRSEREKVYDAQARSRLAGSYGYYGGHGRNSWSDFTFPPASYI